MAFPAYSVLLIAQNAVFLLPGNAVTIHYGPNSACCYPFHGDSTPTEATGKYVEDSSKYWYIFDVVLQAVERGVPPVVTFISFIICSVKLLSTSDFPTEAALRGKRRSAVTVTMFTGLFLVCNLPLFINLTIVLLQQTLTPDTSMFSTNFMHWYSWLIGGVVFPVLNAVLNPVLYYCRMAGLREWIWAV